ncbi:MAG TPA: AsmA family protein [Candidatus Sulfotelmatobacter sp.]|nr:AsmA family protein [Candidatus Sulfotelmatobacter sp.]
MSRLRKWWRPAALLAAIVIVSQVGVSLLVRTHRVHAYLVRHLERAFGRPVEVSHFSVLILPRPSLDAEEVTVGEDPAFGNEYFLRSEHLSASLRWTGFLTGHFEFGTLSLSRPSLNLVRSQEGRWNLERWLPPAKINVPGGLPAVYNVARALSTPANHLTRIDIDDGRVNFKIIDEKLPFALTGVSGVVEQVAPGRWQLQVAAAPWRSGAALQTAGTVYVRGDVAGTSARLQPAEFHLHWSEASLADLLRLFRGRDYGIRGEFALDVTAKSGTDLAAPPSATYGDWSYELQARATHIHRWDLTERSDNPGMNVNLEGLLNVATGKAIAHRIVVRTAKSNLRGTASAMISANPSWEIHLDSAGVQAADLLNWYRAFQPDVDETVTVKQYFTGAMTLAGWPLQVKDAAFSSEGGEAKIPGVASPIRIGAIAGGRHRDTLTIEPFHVAYGASAPSSPNASGKKRVLVEGHGVVNVGFTHDFAQRAGHITVDGHLDRMEDGLLVAQAFGRTLNHGWELTGAATAALHWDWNGATPRHWNGHVDVSNAELQAAGLNRPLNLTKTSLTWKDGLRTATIADVDGFGANWTGSISEDPVTDFDGSAKWRFQLHADHLDATELDRWIGPRARPGWLQRLLPSLLGGAPAAPNEHASELVRRINADGELRVDEFTMEKLKFQQVRADGSLDDLHLDLRGADAQWAGGKVHARLSAKFLPQPWYEVTADLDQVNLAQLPAPARSADRFAGTASGTLRFTTQGVGRDELIARLSGRGDVRLRNVEFRGWDVNASVADGEPRMGESRWAAGEGTFTLRDRGIVLAGLRLESGREATLVKGTVSFGRDADLTIQTTSDGRREIRTIEPGHILKISGPLDIPRVSVENTAAHQPAD